MVLVLYTLVDKVIVPLVKGKSGNGKHTDTAAIIHRLEQISAHQNELHTQWLGATEKRIDRNEAELAEIRGGVSEISASVASAMATLEFLQMRHGGGRD